MSRLTYIFLAAVMLTGCSGGGKSGSDTETHENRNAGYDEIVSFLIQGFECDWESIDPNEKGLSSIYQYRSQYAGYAIQDINGDGTDELLVGDLFPDGGYDLYDIFTLTSDGSPVHLASGGERDRFMVNGAGVITEYGSNSAFESFSKGYVIKDGKLEETESWNDSLMILDFENIAEAASGNQSVGAFGEQRDLTDEDIALFRKVTDDSGMTEYTPLSVSTQTVAGINYRFWCRFEGVSDNKRRKSADSSDAYGYCWITVLKPLPGQGEPRITSIKKDKSAKSLKIGQ